ncbi:hypothetical protein GGP85_001126 [Salinibacter ruber]|uniref:hypothetical protein n=1 Tax=Salinibacter ruber TaxID=146919 RepID=UPI00216AAD6A|nr:hypothetical protein [Salinibacter ruber]MCS3627709.1 hypothetical protein [Salinibacter ruber]MCS3825692.1 hypothetical protein [Salinibacter ruber]MCS4144617.1 hypothetical protein [Salinibacter ruber]
MHRLRSSSTMGRWAVALGLILVVGPLLQAVTPCRGAGGGADGASAPVVTTAASNAQWSCSATDAGAMVRAVSSEWSTNSLDGPLGDEAIGDASAELPPVRLDAQRPPSPPISPTLDALRPVVLQI